MLIWLIVAQGSNVAEPSSAAAKRIAFLTDRDFAASVQICTDYVDCAI
jgi:hypothetical protein